MYFFIYFAINLLNHFVNVTFAMWCVSLRRNFAEASLIANASLTFISLSCGFFIQAQSLPVYVRWIKYISYVYWGFGALSSNGIASFNPSNRVEFADNFFDCPYGNVTNYACTPYMGNFVMDQLGIPRYFVTTGVLALMGFVLFYLVTAWMFLQFIPVRMSFSKQIPNNEREEMTVETVSRRKIAERKPQEVTIRVRDLKLWITKTVFRKQLNVHILQGITVDFVPGRLNVIMGPSGMTLQFQLDRWLGQE